MGIMDIVMTAIAVASIVTSWAVLYLTYNWRIKKEAEMLEMEYKFQKDMSRFETVTLSLKGEIFELKEQMAGFGLETMKVRSEDHDRAIESIRRDLLDIQVLSGTLPSTAGTMRQEIENTLEALKSVQSNYLETRAIVDRTKEQVEKLAEAYSSLHFTGKELEELRDELEDLSRRSS